jgi:hypothetical protein
MLICYLCTMPLRNADSQRRGAHALCLQRRPAASRYRAQMQLRLMTLPLAPPGQPRFPRRHWTAAGAHPLAYLLALANQGRWHAQSIVGRCWIEATHAPATRPVTVLQTKRWSDA